MKKYFFWVFILLFFFSCENAKHKIINFYKNGNIKKEVYLYKDGEKKFIEYNNDSTVSKVYFKKNDALNGLYTEYYPNEKIKEKGYYLNNKKNGFWKYYYEDSINKNEFHQVILFNYKRDNFNIPFNLKTNSNGNNQFTWYKKIYYLENFPIILLKIYNARKLTLYHAEKKTNKILDTIAILSNITMNEYVYLNAKDSIFLGMNCFKNNIYIPEISDYYYYSIKKDTIYSNEVQNINFIFAKRNIQVVNLIIGHLDQNLNFKNKNIDTIFVGNKKEYELKIIKSKLGDNKVCGKIQYIDTLNNNTRTFPFFIDYYVVDSD